MAYSLAFRKAVSILVALSGTSGSGKTLSALLIAAGLANGKKVGLLDTENDRGSMYADDPLVMEALPKGYHIDSLTQPFSPAAYIAKIKEAEDAGIAVLVIDSATHEWEGYGGCTDIAENNKLKGMPNWAKAKTEHKRLMNYILSTPMHIIFCVRAREKSKPVKDPATGKEVYVAMGIQPVQEKNFMFEMMLSLQLDEASHFAVPVKVPRMLKPFFPKEGKLLSRQDGAAVHEWNASGRPVDDADSLKKRAKLAAELGVDAYKKFFAGLPKPQKEMLAAMPDHDENKNLASFVDEEAKRAQEQPQASTEAA